MEATAASVRDRTAAERPQLLFVVTEPQARERVFRAVSELREEGVGATIDLGGRSLKGQMKQAGRLEVPWVVIVGPEEWEREAAILRDMRRRRSRRRSRSPGCAARCSTRP